METPYGEIPDRLVKDMHPQEMHDLRKRRYSRRTMLRGAAAAGIASAVGPVGRPGPLITAPGGPTYRAS